MKKVFLIGTLETEKTAKVEVDGHTVPCKPVIKYLKMMVDVTLICGSINSMLAKRQ